MKIGKTTRLDFGKCTWLTSIVCSTVFLLNQQASAETVGKNGRFGGITLRYKVILPNGYDPARAYPAVLAFPGGRQTIDGVDSSLDRNWRAEAEGRGYIIVSPAAPSNHTFFEQGAERLFPEFLDQILRDYKIEGGKFHIAGASNGGLSAFYIAAMHPQYFRSVTGFPGYLQYESDSKINALKPLCMYMHVGERDPEWLAPMQRQFESFREKGFHVRFSIEADEGHGIQGLAGEGAKRLFDQLEEAARGCQF